MSRQKTSDEIEAEMREWLASQDGCAATNEVLAEVTRFRLHQRLAKLQIIEARLDKAREIPLDVWWTPFTI